MINQSTRSCKIFLVFAMILYLCSNTYAREERKYERPGDLFSPLKIPLLEDPERDTWQKPEKILNALKIEKGQMIADIGAGSGYLTVKLSERVGTTGTVYAVDVQQEMLHYISKRLSDKGLKNVMVKLGALNDPKLPAEVLDIAILLSTYHEIAQPIDFMKKIKPALKSGGRLAILEFTEESPIGPPLQFRLPEDIVIHEVMQAGFTLSEKHTFLLPYQYFLIFTPSHE
ncbi:MAG: methyltransferase domain-containing protein [Candidatus Jettenia sp. CY-1]|nr:methyltransferase domain-containing protein [Candidatus Jettenia sp.]WKZ19743.1 MAG: methyltransferase domain-containing protein [Candidatus Jettenia sp. CY-1]